MLIRLPNGDYIHPQTVRQIKATDTMDNLASRGFIPPRVSLFLESGVIVNLECATYEKACQLRDDLAIECGYKE